MTKSFETYLADYLEEEYFRACESDTCCDSFLDNLAEHIKNARAAYDGGAR